ncbi:hypothetical protein NSQ77_19360 [Oceanobacillus sp. FSL K6-2867]|uniref:MotE family protein n=1 Tax=Oceanobacillus sp. FSL K6-2867 TaxID=2954748 RepID=UPI0030DD7859
MKKKKKNPILRLLFAVVIPLIIIVAIVVTIMEVAGFNVMDWTKHQASTIPVISNLVASEKAAPVQNDSHEQAIVDEKDGEITSLNETIRELEATINEQKQDIVRLENSLETALEDGESSEKNSPDDSLTSIIDSFEEMKGSKAAPIVENLETDTAVAILQELSKDHRASILSSMDPEKAAKLTQLLFSSAN